MLSEGALSWLIGLSALALGWANLWRARLAWRPEALELEVEDPGPGPVPAQLEPLDAALRALGFTPLGTHREHAPLGPSLLCFDYAHEGQGTFASLWVPPRFGPTPPLFFWVPRLEAEGPPVRLLLLTPGPPGHFALSANYRRRGASVAGVHLSGGLEGAPPERLLRAHARRVAEVGGAVGPWTLDARVGVARAWLAGVGKTEVRQQHAAGLLWTIGALGMVAALLLERAVQ
jgi:hypothetical protein